MATFRNLLLSVVAVPAVVLAQSSNADLFSFLMPDAQLIAGIHVDAAKTSPFGEFVLSRIPMGDKFLEGFTTQTGINPLSDVQEVVIGWNGATNADGRWLIAAHGNFGASIETLEVNALKDGATIMRLAGVDLITVSTAPGASAQAANVCLGLFTDGFTDLAGDCTSVSAAIQFSLNSGGPASALGLKARQLRAQEDLWFASAVPVSQIANLLPAGSANGAVDPSAILKSNLFQAIQQISGGVKLNGVAQGVGAQLSGEVMMDSPQNATALLNVVNFIASMLQTNAASGPAAGGITTLLSNLQASVNGSTLSVGLSVSEPTLEQLFQQAGLFAMK